MKTSTANLSITIWDSQTVVVTLALTVFGVETLASDRRGCLPPANSAFSVCSGPIEEIEMFADMVESSTTNVCDRIISIIEVPQITKPSCHTAV